MPPPLPPDTLAPQISAALLARHNLLVSPTWLASFLASSTRHPPPPLPALTSTAQFRLLASDFRDSLSTTNAATLLPLSIGAVGVKETRLAGDVAVQVVDVEDVGSSRWSQVEALERVERGEEVRGREVVRSVPVEAGEGPTGEGGPAQAGVAGAAGPHRVLLQDARGTTVWGFERVKVPRLGLGEVDGVSMGMKVVLRAGCVVRRGVVMLSPESVGVLGGKVEAWDRAWREGRKERLRRGVEAEQGAGRR